MATQGLLSVVEDVLHQHATTLSLDRDLVSRRQEEAASRRYEAAAWLRRTVGVVAARDLPEEPSEDEFRLGLRNGIILCNALNKLHPATIPKVVEAPSDFTPPPDGAPLCAYQYFENLRNFLVALEDLHLPTFEASDLEKGGKATRVVNSVLALKSHSQRKGKSHWISSNSSFSSLDNGNNISTCSSSSSTKYFVRKNSEPFMNSLFRSQSSEALSVEQNLSLDVSIESSQMTASHSLHMLVSTMLSGKKPEEVPELVGSVISRVVEEFEKRMSTQNEMVTKTMKDFESCMQPSSTSLSTNRNEVKIEKVEKNCQEIIDSEETSTDKQAAVSMDDFKSCRQPSKVSLSTTSNKVVSKDTLCKPPCVIEEDVEVCNSMINSDEASKEKKIVLKLNFNQQERKIQELRKMLCTVKSGMENMRLHYCDEFINLGKHLGNLSHAALGYHKVLEENRKLYNIVQDLKGNIRVYCRIRPLKDNTATPITFEDDQITILTPAKYGKEGRKSFKFNKVFGPSATQEEVFSDMRPLIRSVLDGYNVCIFAYGQTGSGKTHTMTGPKELTEETQGVNYRALNDLFYMSEIRKETFSYEISVQMIEIYNEQVRDLLTNNSGTTKRLEIRSSSQKGGLAVPDANIVPVYSTSDVIELMNVGHRNRAVSFTAMNDRSSRSHSCLTVHVQGRDLTSSTVLRGSMHLVDLAGSERVDKSEAKGERLKEAQHINKSLSALGDVISSLAQKNSHVPYRNSKLTQLLQDSLGGQAKTLMFIHVRPEFDGLGETLSTLKFAERVATVELGSARVNKDSTVVKELKEQLVNLKAQITMKDAGEVEQMRSPDIYQTKSCMETTMQPSVRLPMEEVGNLEVRSNLATIQKKLNLDACETASETDSASWVDKTIIENGNDENLNTSNCSSLNSSVNRSGLTFMSALPNYSYQRYPSDISIGYQDVNCSTLTRSEPAGSDGSDELELGTTYCSSEHDMMMTWHSDLPKVLGLGNDNNNNGIALGLKKPQVKLAASPDIRSASRGSKPSPSRRIQNAPSLTAGKMGNAKRKVAGKQRNGK